MPVLLPSSAMVFTSFVVATVVGALSLLPGGIGTFDATCVSMLAASGVPVAASLAALVLYRAVTLVLPLPFGLWCVEREFRP